MLRAASPRAHASSGSRTGGIAGIEDFRATVSMVVAPWLSPSPGGGHLAELVDVPTEEVVEYRPNRCDRAELTDLRPRRRDCRSNHVRGELELETEQEPDGETHPDLATPNEAMMRCGTR